MAIQEYKPDTIINLSNEEGNFCLGERRENLIKFIKNRYNTIGIKPVQLF
jgi:hypothetical protein